MSSALSSNAAETVIVGAGIVGSSIAYHLAKRGYTDAIVIERGTLSSPLGSTGHAPGLLAQISSSPVMTRLASHSADLYSRLPAENPAYTQVGSIEVARDEARMRQFKDKIQRGKDANIEASLLSTDEIKEMVPMINADSLVGGLFVPGDGVLNARSALSGIVAEAMKSGIEFKENTSMTGVEVDDGKVVAVTTDKGRIECKRLIIAVGIWGASLLQELGIELPLFPVQHPYIYTSPMAELAETQVDATFPLVRDLDNVAYFRQHGTRMGYGWYEHAPLTADTAKMMKADLPYDDSVFNKSCDLNLFPFVENTPVETQLNGVFSMTPDGAPLLGEVEGFSGLWLSEAVWVTHAGGIGKVMADLLLDGKSDIDVTGFNANRYKREDVAKLREQSLNLYNDIYAWPAA